MAKKISGARLHDIREAIKRARSKGVVGLYAFGHNNFTAMVRHEGKQSPTETLIATCGSMFSPENRVLGLARHAEPDIMEALVDAYEKASRAGLLDT